jgi:hypothetical protein
VDWRKWLRDDYLEFYKKVKQAAIEQEKSNRLYRKVRYEKSSSSTKTLTKQSKEQNVFVRRKLLRSKARVTRTPRKDRLGKNGNAGVVEKGHRLSDCRKTSKDDKERMSRRAASRRRNSQF